MTGQRSALEQTRQMSLLVGALVARSAVQAVLAQSIDAGIANMRQPGVVFATAAGRRASPHALLVALTATLPADPPSGTGHRLAQQFAIPSRPGGTRETPEASVDSAAAIRAASAPALYFPMPSATAAVRSGCARRRLH